MIVFALFFCILPFVDNLHVHGSASVAQEASHSYSYLNETGSSRNCEETLNSITRHSIAADSLALGTHVCSRHVTTANVLFRCYRHRNSTVNHYALLRGLLRKSLKFQQLALLTYQQYFSSRTPYVIDWTLYATIPCLRIIQHCTECSTSHVHVSDLQRDYRTLGTIYRIIGTIIHEDENYAVLISSEVQAMKALRRSTKQLMCELHSVLLMHGSHDATDGFVGDVVESSAWCVYDSISSRIERDVYLLRQIRTVSSELYARYKEAI
uniref:Uncharacterized protein LOC111132682 n=1 Tax=Crassostrea virginica TaxID=6565 RepID=A0A8B8E9P9_CRAVI|nr:uncharacterized protein LOC111132682 [Crassostrea virginica]